MLNYIEHLRKKPEREKRKAVLLISVSVTLAIAIVWVVFTAMRIDQTDFSFNPGKAGVKTPSFSETFSIFTDQVGKIFNKDSGNSDASTTP